MTTPLPGDWLLVKDHEGKIWWVNQTLNEVSEDPPNLDELRQNFVRVKNKSQMMEKRSEDDKKNARKKILRNIPNPDDAEFGTIREELQTKEFLNPNMGTTKNQKQQQAAASAVKGGNEPQKKSAQKKNQSPGVIEDLFDQQTTDPKMKRGTLEDSIGSFDFGQGRDFIEEDPYKYTKSTLKKANEDLTTPPWKSSQSRRVRGDDKMKDSSLDQNLNDMPILEMNLDLNDLGDELDGHFITPSGKKNEPVRDKKQKNPGGARDSAVRDSGQQMVNSSVLEKMLSDIQNMQLKMSTIEEDNNMLKRKNIELVNEQKSIKQKAESEMRSAKQEIEHRIKEKESKLEEMVKEELARKGKSDDGEANLNIQKDIRGIKELLQQSLMKNTINQASGQTNTSPSNAQPNPSDIQSSLPVVDSQLMPNSHAQLGGTGQHNHSFGLIQESSPGPMGENKQNQSTLPNNQNFMMSSLGSPFFGSNVRPPMPSQVKQPPNPSGFPSSKASASLPSGHPAITTVQKWLEVIFAQKELLKKVKSELSRKKGLLKNKKLSIMTFEMEMNSEMGSLELDKGHPLVGKIKKNLQQQVANYNSEERYYQEELVSFKMRRKNLAMLESTLNYLQTLGPLGPDQDKHLEDIYTTLKTLEHFCNENDDGSMDSLEASSAKSSKDSKQPPAVSEIEIDSDQEHDPTTQSRGFTKKEGAPVSVEAGEAVLLEETPMELQIKTDITKTKHLLEATGEQTDPQTRENKSASLLRPSSNPQKQGKPPGKKQATKTNYFNEFGRVAAGAAAQRRSEAEDYSQPPAIPAGFSSSLGYYPDLKRGFDDQSATNMRRYFHSQSKWYSDMRSEVSDYESR